MYKVEYIHPLTGKLTSETYKAFEDAIRAFHIYVGNHNGGVKIIHPNK